MPRPELTDEQYLGDGVAAGFDGFQVWIFLEKGHAERSAKEGIAFEPATLIRLSNYIEKIRDKYWRS